MYAFKKRWHFVEETEDGPVTLCFRQPVEPDELWEDQGGPPEPRCKICMERAGFPTVAYP